MATRTIKREQFLPVSLDEAWNFFSTPLNLSKIKPANVIFEILNELPDKIYKGLFINYKIAPILKIPLNWTTEITQTHEKKYFIDEQRIGPFQLWHHEHHFKEIESGVLMTDILNYNIGKSLPGKLAGLLFVDKKVDWIFNYRYKKIEELFC